MLQCITFDLDDTLWDNKPVMQRAEQMLADWLAVHYPRIAAVWSVERLQRHRHAVLATHPEIAHDLVRVRRQAMAALGAQVGEDDAWITPALTLFYRYRNQVSPFPGVLELLGRLRRVVRVGAVTNGNADLVQIGLRDAFDFVVYAAQVGAAKPSTEIFCKALRQAGVCADRSVHVGDDPIRDVGGAMAAGMCAVWVNPDDSPWPGGGEPPISIGSVLELEAALSGRIGTS